MSAERLAVIEYLKKTIPNFHINRRGAVEMFTCPYCNERDVARFIPGGAKIDCMKCKNTGDLLDVIKQNGDFNEGDTHENVMDRIYTDLNLVNNSKINRIFDEYVKLGWDLVPLKHKDKVPYESSDWPNREHKDKSEWLTWLDTGLNFGVKCGTRSGITVLDIDTDTLPADIDLMKGNPLIQRTGRGYHLIYKYIDLPTAKWADKYIELLNAGRQIVIYPSQIVYPPDKNMGSDPVGREFETENFELTDMPENLVKYLKGLLEKDGKIEQPEEVIDFTNVKINPDDFKLKNGQLQGCCNDSFIKLGGVLSTQLPTKDVEFVLKTFNNCLLDKPMPPNEINAMCKSLDRYIKKDEKTVAKQIFKYLNIVEFANAKEIREALGLPKEDIDTALAYLTKEGYLIRRGRTFSIIKKAEWKTELCINYNALPFEMPYFGKCANIAWGDMILLAAQTKRGKTTIAINMIKAIVDDMRKKGLNYPIYYISSENGSRFARTAMHLKLNEGDFKWDFIVNPTSIKLEDNAITILDWLQVDDKSQTDVIFKHFATELYKSQGCLIAFQQLKENGDWFAPNMCKMYPALASKYVYTNEDGTEGQWEIEAIREPKVHMKRGIIPCKYLTNEKLLVEVNA